MSDPASVGRRAVGDAETRAAQRSWWDASASAYQASHGPELAAAGFQWCPEGVTESTARLLGDVAGQVVLEVGCGAAQCSAWLLSRGARVVAVDLSLEQLRHGVGGGVPLVQADAAALPIADGSVDAAFSAYGAVQFVADSAQVMREVARVLRPGGRWVFSTTHPLRWAMPDDPGPDGLVVASSYFDRTPYVEGDADGRATYVEHHRTVGDRVREIVAAGLEVVDLLEPEWPAGRTTSYPQWGELRGRLVPGTAIWVSRRPG